jgi:hypothetical protein
LKDLSARLPYGVWLNVKGQDGPKLFDFDEELWSLWIEDSRFSINDRGEGDYEGICEIKPYLRPIHKLTEEELEELEFLTDSDYVDYCNKHHIDYRNLIPKGLALEAKEGMYIIKEQ